MTRVTNTLDFVTIQTTAAGSLTWNMKEPKDHQEPFFINIAKQARGWDNSSQAVTALNELDMTGAPATGNSRNFFFSARGDDGSDYSHLNGEYKVLWDGASGATMSFDVGNYTIDSQAAGEAVLTITAHTGNQRFTIGDFDSDDPPTNIRMYATEHETDYLAGEHFLPDFIAVLTGSTFGLRFMDWMATNDSTLANWADYPLESNQSWGRVPFSIMLALANKMDARPWFCSPVSATDAFITSMATTIHAGLNSSLKALLEYSNEIWNTAFDQLDDAAALGNAEWPSTGESDQVMARNWVGKRTVDMMALADAVSATRFLGVISGQAANTVRAVDALDAPIWKQEDAGTYVAPHTIVDYLAIADYVIYTGDGTGFMTDFDAGNLDDAKASFLGLCATSLATTKGWIDDHVALLDATDTVDGLTRDLTLTTYEGVSNHYVLSGNTTAPWFIPIAHNTGDTCIVGQCVTGANGRIYQAETAGTMGATAPSHTNAGSVSDGAINWHDWTGELIAASSGSALRIDNAKGTQLHTGQANVATWSMTTLTTGDYVQNAAGRVYEVTTGGVATTEPTHTSGTVTTGGVEYRAVLIVLSDSDARLEFVDWFYPLLLGADVTDYILQSATYLKSVGAVSPAAFTIVGRPSEKGVFGCYTNFADTRAGRVHDAGDMIADWGRTNGRWWA